MSSPDHRFCAYEIYDQTDMVLTAAPLDRAWMDQTPQRFAYRCLPLTIANQAGWLLHNPATFTARWNGGPNPEDLLLEFETPGARPAPPNPWSFSVDSVTVGAVAAARDDRVTSHFGSGVVTFSMPFLFRTPPGINLWVKGPSNWIKDGVQALEGVVETDWLPASFTMNWKLTRPHYPVRFEKDEPICMLVPVPAALAEELEPVRLTLAADPEFHREHTTWMKSRADFLLSLKQGQPDALRRGWQRDYTLGFTPSGARAPGHRTRLELKEFTRPSSSGSEPEA
jgi:hypothetical protein